MNEFVCFVAIARGSPLKKASSVMRKSGIVMLVDVCWFTLLLPSSFFFPNARHVSSSSLLPPAQQDVAGQTAAEETADEGHCEHAPADCERRLVAISQNPVAAEDEATRASASGKAEESTQTSETGMSVTELDNPSSEMSPVASGEDALESTTAVESVRLPRVLGTDLLALLKSDFLAGLHEELSPQVLSLICPAVPEELLPAASSQRPEVDNTSVADEAGPVDKHALLEHAAAEETAPRVQELVTNHTSQLPSKAETDGVTKLVEPAPADGLPSKVGIERVLLDVGPPTDHIVRETQVVDTTNQAFRGCAMAARRSIAS